jgi:hypothetical protein
MEQITIVEKSKTLEQECRIDLVPFITKWRTPELRWELLH